MNNSKILAPDESLAKVEGWIKSSNFENNSPCVNEYIDSLKIDDNDTVITSVTKEEWDKNNIKQITTQNSSELNRIQNTSTVNSYESAESMVKLVETLKSNNMIKGVSKINNASPWELYEGRTKSKSEPPDQFSTIIEGEESDMPEIKRNENVFKVRTDVEYAKADVFTSVQPPRPSSRHKRHVDTSFLTKSNVGLNQDRKARKRKTLEKIGASVIITAFIIIMWETGFVAFILFVLDFFWNSEQYGFQNFLFG